MASPSCLDVLVTEDVAAAIRAPFDEQCELSAAIELRRRFPGITDNSKAREPIVPPTSKPSGSSSHSPSFPAELQPLQEAA